MDSYFKFLPNELINLVMYRLDRRSFFNMTNKMHQEIEYKELYRLRYPKKFEDMIIIIPKLIPDFLIFTNNLWKHLYMKSFGDNIYNKILDIYRKDKFIFNFLLENKPRLNIVYDLFINKYNSECILPYLEGNIDMSKYDNYLLVNWNEVYHTQSIVLKHLFELSTSKRVIEYVDHLIELNFQPNLSIWNKLNTVENALLMEPSINRDLLYYLMDKKLISEDIKKCLSFSLFQKQKLSFNAFIHYYELHSGDNTYYNYMFRLLTDSMDPFKSDFKIYCLTIILDKVKDSKLRNDIEAEIKII